MELRQQHLYFFRANVLPCADGIDRVEFSFGVVAGNEVVELEAGGGPKGKFAKRLAGALEVIESRRAEVVKEKLRQNLSDDDSLLLLQEGAGGQRNPGLVRD